MKNWISVGLGTFTVVVLLALILGEVLSGKMQNEPFVLHAAHQTKQQQNYDAFMRAQPFPLAVKISSVNGTQAGSQFRGTATATLDTGTPKENSFQVSYTCTVNPGSTGELQHARWNVENRELGVLVDGDMGRAEVCNLMVKN
jgi:hypothetical protein